MDNHLLNYEVLSVRDLHHFISKRKEISISSTDLNFWYYFNGTLVSHSSVSRINQKFFYIKDLGPTELKIEVEVVNNRHTGTRVIMIRESVSKSVLYRIGNGKYPHYPSNHILLRIFREWYYGPCTFRPLFVNNNNIIYR